MMGVETAPASRVAVITHVALAGAVSRRTGRSLMTGTSRVCMTATVMPAKARMGTMPPERRAFGGSGSSCMCRVCRVRRMRGASRAAFGHPGSPKCVQGERFRTALLFRLIPVWIRQSSDLPSD